MTEHTPQNPSSDYSEMECYWAKASAILGGADAMRRAGPKFLPKFRYEAEDDYALRLKSAKFTNIFADIVDTLASKPFESEIVVEECDFESILEDIDGQGNHIHVFAASVFHSGIADALSWVMVDYPDTTLTTTVAQEKEAGVRPYWIHLNAQDVLAVYSETVQGKETLTHVRIREDSKERVGFGEATRQRVRVVDREVQKEGGRISLGPPIWTLYEKMQDRSGQDSWLEIASGTYSIGFIPLFPFVTGSRRGNSWVIKPPMERAADLQIEHYQQESELKYMRQRTAFAMLAGNGVTPPKGDDGRPVSVPVGPFSVLYAPPSGDGGHGQWQVLEPAGSSLTFCSTEVDKTEAQLRELGRQPLTAQSGNITTITAAFAGDKAHTVLEAWSLNLKDFLENCLKATALWVGSSAEPTVQINTDFSFDLREETGAEELRAARERGDISQKTWFEETKRRGTIGPNREFDGEDGELKRLEDEVPGEPDPLEDWAARPDMEIQATEFAEAP